MGVRTHPIFINFNSGELSPKVEGRIDLDRYFNGVNKLQRFICLPQGGVETSGGFHYVAGAKNDDKECRLIGFEFSELQNYILEFGDLYIRFFMDRGQIQDVDSYTKLLIHGDGDDASTVFTDDGVNSHTVTAGGNVQVDTSEKVFGSGSILFDGVGDKLTVADHADWHPAAAVFTFDIRFRRDDPGVTNFTIPFIEQYVDADNRWSFRYYYQEGAGAASQFVFYLKQTGVEEIALTWNWGGAVTDKPAIGQWYHVELIRGWGGNANSWAVTVDGALVGAAQTETDDVPDFAADPAIGYSQHTGLYYKGRFDEIRWSKGVARNTAAFNPPTLAYPLGEGGTPYEITSPYYEVDLPFIRSDQSDEDMYLVHPDYHPRKLTRTAHTAWTLEEVDFIDGPYEDEIDTPTITPSHVDVGGERVTNGGFDADSDWNKGANWTIAGGKALKSAGGVNNLDQDTTEANTEIYKVIYTIDSISGGDLTVSIGGANGTARGAAGTYTEYITATGAGDLTFTPSAAGVQCQIDDVSVIRVVTLTASDDLFQTGHVGALWRIKHVAAWGYVKIDSYVSATVVRAVVKTVLGAGASDGHMEGAWSDVNGFPRAICFHEGRLLFAGSYEWPNTIWASKGGVPEEFTPGALANDAYGFTTSDLNIIRWIAPSRQLCIGALNSEATAVGPTDGPITPIDPPRIHAETTHGSDEVGILRIGKAILFLQKAGRKIREFRYNYEDDAYSAPDLTELSEHLVKLGILELAYQQELNSVVWALRSDGVLLGCTYDRINNIVGWHRHPTDGEFESIATIPYQDVDQLWAVVNRTIDGSTKRYIEYLDPDIHVDSGLTYSGAPITTLSGLDHLKGETVKVVGDGAVYPDEVVTSGGTITIEYAASDIYVGLGYLPRLVANRPEVKIAGTSQPLLKKWGKLWTRVIETMGITINGQIVPARDAGMDMDEAPVPFNGDIPVENLGWDRTARVTIEQPLPLPASIVCIFGTLVVGDG